MIYTVTFNPALDYIVRVRNFKAGQINRTYYEKILPGGKGINVSIVLKNLGHMSTALGFVAGFTGREIAARLSALGIRTDFVEVERGMSRINLKMKSSKETAGSGQSPDMQSVGNGENAAGSGQSPDIQSVGNDEETAGSGQSPDMQSVGNDEETEINGQGPDIQPEDIDELFRKLDALSKGDLLVISGSVPGALPGDMYEKIMSRLDGRGIDIVVDAERDLLVNVLKYRPFLIKPNNHELGAIYGVELRERDEVIPYAGKLQEMGARNVLVSMAGEGAVFISENGGILTSPAPSGKVVNSVGAGDSMVAGFLTGFMESGSYEQAFRMGLCTGSASSFSLDLATRPEVEALLKTL